MSVGERSLHTGPRRNKINSLDDILATLATAIGDRFMRANCGRSSLTTNIPCVAVGSRARKFDARGSSKSRPSDARMIEKTICPYVDGTEELPGRLRCNAKDLRVSCSTN